MLYNSKCACRLARQRRYDTRQNPKRQPKAAMSILHTFITLALKTTGLDPKEAEIIGIDCVKVKEGEVFDRFHTHVRPRMGVPEETTRLTGIAFKDVRNAPRIGAALENFMAFAGDMPIIAHSGRFEARFLSEASRLPFGNDMHSVRDLARIALPRLSDHRADAIAAYLGVESDCVAERLAGIYAGVLDAFARYVIEHQTEHSPPLARQRGHLASHFCRFGQRSDQARIYDAHARGRRGRLALVQMWAATNRAQRQRNLSPLDIDMLGALFEAGGAFEQQTRGYEVRAEQIEMMRAVAGAFNDDELLVAEAGTGVGKSMAYLTPAIHHAAQNGRRVIVSTNTKNLQEQLFFKDLPHLERVLDIPFSYVLLKGRGNYICLNRWQAALANVDAFFSEDERVGALAPRGMGRADANRGHFGKQRL